MPGEDDDEADAEEDDDPGDDDGGDEDEGSGDSRFQIGKRLMSFKGAKVPQSLSSILMCITHFLHQGEEKTSGLILLNIGGKEFMTKV